MKLSDKSPTGAMWESDEFEDLVSRALIACYESKVYQEPPVEKGHHFYLAPRAIVTPRDFAIMRSAGPYFAPEDRYTLAEEYWHEIDGLPKTATWAFARPQDSAGHTDLTRDAYLEIMSAEKIDRFPKGCVLLPGRYIAKYRVCHFYPNTSGKGIEAYALHVGLKQSGRFVVEQLPENNSKSDVYVGALLGFNADRRFLWSVDAVEGGTRAGFGVYMEQVKSLFYARSIPLTKTGRRRPILHWVRAHQRRIKEGIDIDVTKHLRGITNFEMFGTNFQITQPVKPKS